MLVCATARSWSGTTVAHRGGVAKHAVRGVCRADDGARLRNWWADNTTCRSHGKDALSSHVCQSNTWTCCNRQSLQLSKRVTCKTWMLRHCLTTLSNGTDNFLIWCIDYIFIEKFLVSNSFCSCAVCTFTHYGIITCDTFSCIFIY